MLNSVVVDDWDVSESWLDFNCSCSNKKPSNVRDGPESLCWGAAYVLAWFNWTALLAS